MRSAGAACEGRAAGGEEENRPEQVSNRPACERGRETGLWGTHAARAPSRSCRGGPSGGAVPAAPPGRGTLHEGPAPGGERPKEIRRSTSARTSDLRFVELFAGTGRLAAAVEEVLGPGSAVPLDLWAGWDILTDEGFSEAVELAARATWVHCAPPCATFSRARRPPLRPLRSEAKPEGFGSERTELANEMVRRTMALTRVAEDHGHFWSIENPESSLMWELAKIKKLLKSAHVVNFDQCAYGGPGRKATRFVTNASWLCGLTRRCEEVAVHSHVTLAGTVEDPRACDGSRVWRTTLAAEYPEALCSAAASAFRCFLAPSAASSVELPPPAAAPAFVRVGRFGNVLVRTGPGQVTPVGHDTVGRSAKDISTLYGVRGRDVREQENSECVGGLRNPNKACARSPQLRAGGVTLRALADEAIRCAPQLLLAADHFGQDAAGGFRKEDVEVAREVFAKGLGIVTPVGKVGYWAEAFRQIIRMCGDVDVDIPEWIEDGFPLGILRPIAARGVFPRVEQDSAAVEASRLFGELLEKENRPLEAHVNYRSFYDEAEAADADFDRVVALGYAEKFDTEAEVRAKFGNVTPAKVAVVAKLRKDGTKKIRIIVDMLRAGINGKIQIRERLVLPRLTDLAEGVVDIMECQRPNHDIELFAVDFKDAFYTMGIADQERQFVVARGSFSWYVFRCVAFGLASGPILWGRLAAAAARFGQSMFRPEELRVQVYVDDPAGAVCGPTRAARTRSITSLLILWQVLGFDLSWGKAQRGRAIDWIGAKVEVVGTGILQVTLSDDKTSDMKLALEHAAQVKGMIGTKEVLQLAGKMSWAASVVPRARPFVAHLWGAIVDSSASSRRGPPRARRRPTKLMFVRRIDHAVRWLLALLSPESRVTRRFTVAGRRALVRCTIRTDASPFGMGGVLLDPQGSPKAYWSDGITREDCDRFAAKVGDPAWQSEWEFLAVLTSLVAFRDLVGPPDTHITIQTDNLAALTAAMKLASSAPLMNAIASEVSLQLETMQVRLALAQHVPGTLNYVADALSRQSVGKEVPACLRSVRRVDAPIRDDAFYRAWPREWKRVPPWSGSRRTRRARRVRRSRTAAAWRSD